MDLKQRLEDELRQLDYELRTELPKELQRAAALGDLRENGEYESARNRQDYLRLRIATLRKRLADISMLDVDRLPRDKVGYGSTVGLYDLDRQEEFLYRIVMSEDADADKGLISTTSPIGRALIGRGRGGAGEVKTPNGLPRVEIISMRVRSTASGKITRI